MRVSEMFCISKPLEGMSDQSCDLTVEAVDDETGELVLYA